MVIPQNSVKYAKANKLYCRMLRQYIHLCRIHTCEHWEDCYKAIVDMGYELVANKHKHNIAGLMWKLNK